LLGLGAALLLLASPDGAAAQTATPLGLDPAVANQGTSLLFALDAGGLVSGGRRAESTVISLARGMRFDARSREKTCSRSQASGGGCPKASKIGFGRSVVTVTGFLAPGGETEVAWSIGAYLGKPERPGDLASIRLRSELLGADRVDQLLAPLLGSSPPRVSASTARVTPPPSTDHGPQIRFGTLPGEVKVPASITARPTHFDLALTAARRVRENFTRHVRVRTLSGYRTEAIPDHRLVGHELLRNPSSCRSRWRLELRSEFPGGARRSASDVICAAAP
jgi:hypothetical protein